MGTRKKRGLPATPNKPCGFENTPSRGALLPLLTSFSGQALPPGWAARTVFGGLSPIETVLAQLQKDLAKREMDDLKANKAITKAQFKQRAAHILNSYSVPKPGQKYSFLRKLVRGMPKRLKQCKKNKYGPCGK